MAHQKPLLPDPTMQSDWKVWARSLVLEFEKFFLGLRTARGGTVALATGVTTTTLLDKRIEKGDVVLLTPVDANAAAALLGVYVPVATVERQVVITHPNSALARTFAYALIGRD